MKGIYSFEQLIEKKNAPADFLSLIALILVGGFGTRLRPLVSTTPRCPPTLNNREPLDGPRANQLGLSLDPHSSQAAC